MEGGVFAVSDDDRTLLLVDRDAIRNTEVFDAVP
jgi:hypothetical protein